MPVSTDFTAFYEQELKEVMVPLEAERLKIKRQGLLGFLFLGISILFFILASRKHDPAFALIAFATFVPAIVFMVLFGTRKNKFTRKFKVEVVGRIIRFIDPSLGYKPDYCISEPEYMASGLYLNSPDRYSGDDYIEGTHGKTVFCFCDLHTEEKINSGKQTSWVTIFKGLFMIADFNKHFAGRTYVWNEEKPQLNFLSRLVSSFANGLEKVKLESPDFEREFIIYSSDQVEARYILTPAFMERVLRLRQITGTAISLSFVNSKVNLAIPRKEAQFEPSFFSRNDFRRVEEFRLTLQLVFDIINELKLNERLWTKE